MTSPADMLAPVNGLDLATAAALAPDQVMRRVGSSDYELSGAEAASRLSQYGPNIVGTRQVSALAGLWGQLRDCFFNEYRAAVPVQQLHDRVRREAVVWRDGRQRSLDVTQVVPGDVVALRIGDIVRSFSKMLATVAGIVRRMLPSQILLNNLLYDTGQMVIPTDSVDPELLARPAAWDVKFVRQFMCVFGPLRSIFDFLPFWIMLSLLVAGPSEFRTGWLTESIATQTLIVYVIRTRRIPFLRSRPSVPMMVIPISAAAIGIILPATPASHVLGFTPLPAEFFIVLGALIVTYVVLVDLAKIPFYRVHPAQAQAPSTQPATDSQRSAQRHRRLAEPFTAHQRRLA